MGIFQQSQYPMTKPNLKDMTLEEIEAFVASLGKERFRARQIMKWIYQQGATSFAEMTNLSREFRADMEKQARIGSLEIVRTVEPSAGIPPHTAPRRSST